MNFFDLAKLIALWLFVFPLQIQVEPADTVKAVLSAPDSELSYERTKLAFDNIIAPQHDASAVTSEVEQLANAAAEIAAIQ